MEVVKLSLLVTAMPTSDHLGNILLSEGADAGSEGLLRQLVQLDQPCHSHGALQP